ncbi:MAG: hypothetical protein H7327_14095 [Herminiimonas sp.]|nr:hypothetical protein [Herminiimonas sp.]
MGSIFSGGSVLTGSVAPWALLCSFLALEQQVGPVNLVAIVVSAVVPFMANQAVKVDSDAEP